MSKKKTRRIGQDHKPDAIDNIAALGGCLIYTVPGIIVIIVVIAILNAIF